MLTMRSAFGFSVVLAAFEAVVAAVALAAACVPDTFGSSVTAPEEQATASAATLAAAIHFSFTFSLT